MRMDITKFATILLCVNVASCVAVGVYVVALVKTEQKRELEKTEIAKKMDEMDREYYIREAKERLEKRRLKRGELIKELLEEEEAM